MTASIGWRALALGARGVTLAAFLAAGASCAELTDPSSPRVEAPTWQHVALGAGDADFVGAIDLGAVRADPVFGALAKELAHRDDIGALATASQIDLVGTLDRDERPSWIAVVHGVDGRPSTRDFGSDATTAVVAPGEWILGEGEALDRVRRGGAGPFPPIAMPSRALFAGTVRARAIPHPRHAVFGDMTEGLEEASVAILGGSHLEVVMDCRYADAASASHAAAATRLALVAVASRSDAPAALARALVHVDFDVTGNDVALRIVLADDLRTVLQTYVEAAAAELSGRRRAGHAAERAE